MGETLTCSDKCNAELGHALECPRYTDAYKRSDPRAKRREQVEAAMAHVDGGGTGPVPSSSSAHQHAAPPAGGVFGLLPPKPARDERRLAVALDFYNRELAKGTDHSRALAAVSADHARVFLDELDRNP